MWGAGPWLSQSLTAPAPAARQSHGPERAGSATMAAGQPPLAQADPVHRVPRAAAGQHAAHRRGYVRPSRPSHPIPDIPGTGPQQPWPWHCVPNTSSSSSSPCSPAPLVQVQAARPSPVTCPPHPKHPSLSEQLCWPQKLELCKTKQKPILEYQPASPSAPGS